MRHIISILVENKFGVLARVSGLFSARGFNISSLCVAETEDDTMSQMTIVVDGDEHILEQVTKQLHKLIDVIKVQDITAEDYIDRELILLKIAVNTEKRHEIMHIAERFKIDIVDVGKDMLTIVAVGDTSHIDALLGLLRTFGIRQIVRTGKIAIGRRV